MDISIREEPTTGYSTILTITALLDFDQEKNVPAIVSKALPKNPTLKAYYFADSLIELGLYIKKRIEADIQF